ncbi:Probable transcription factor PosF21, partial [Linum perenne]
GLGLGLDSVWSSSGLALILTKIDRYLLPFLLLLPLHFFQCYNLVQRYYFMVKCSSPPYTKYSNFQSFPPPPSIRSPRFFLAKLIPSIPYSPLVGASKLFILFRISSAYYSVLCFHLRRATNPTTLFLSYFTTTIPFQVSNNSFLRNCFDYSLSLSLSLYSFLDFDATDSPNSLSLLGFTFLSFMDKDKSSPHGGLPPTPTGGRFPSFSSQGNSYAGVKPEPSSPAFPPLTSSEPGHFAASSDSARFSHDISRMPDNPPKNMGHRRAHSEILTLPDDISFDSDLGVVGVDGPSYSDETEEDILSVYLNMEKLNSSSATSGFQAGESSNTNNVSAADNWPGSSTPMMLDVGSAPTERPRIRHQHSQSMDGSTSIKSEMLMSGSEDASGVDSKKAISAAKLAELALVDPKRAKRIWANRQSAARSKERKMRYIAELERKVQTLQTEATSLSAQLTLLQRDTNGLTAENSELKLRLQTTEQQVHLQDALNDALKEEIQHLKLLTGQLPSCYGAGAGQQLYSNNQSMHSLTAQQFQQLQIHSQKQQQQQQQQQHHQFQQHHLHQLQQQAAAAGDLKMRGVGCMASSTQKDNGSDVNTQGKRD